MIDERSCAVVGGSRILKRFPPVGDPKFGEKKKSSKVTNCFHDHLSRLLGSQIQPSQPCGVKILYNRCSLNTFHDVL